MFRPPSIVSLTTLAVCCAAPAWAADAVPAGGTDAAANDTARVDFQRDVRPLLFDRCVLCHGPDGEARATELRLDSAAAVTADLGGYAAVVPGDAVRSELLNRIFSDDEYVVMPPPDSGKQLTAADRDVLRRWVEQGAAWDEHWAFVPPERPGVPAAPGTRDEGRALSDAASEAPASTLVPRPSSPRAEPPANAVDAFIDRTLAANGLHRSPAADRATLLRRLNLDLVGLPPTPGEVDAFLADDAPDAYARRVERLLASPQYGEKWARMWLDAARYADSDGYEKDKPRQVWFYRDWVIDAFNDNLPYDRFLTEQLAGDLLPDATQNSVVATGFLRNSMINEEGGVDPEQFRMEAMFDRMDALGKGVLGLTVQCAQCHTHKYDPLTHTEYFRLMAFLNNAHEAQVAVYTPGEQMRRAAVLGEVAEIEQGLRHRTPDWKQRMRAWEDDVRAADPGWVTITPDWPLSDLGGQKMIPQPDGSFLSSGYAPTRTNPVGVATLPVGEKAYAFRVEFLTDPNLPRGGPGRSEEGTAALSEFELETVRDGDTARVPFTLALADAEPEPATLPPRMHFPDGTYGTPDRRRTGPAAWAIDGDEETAYGTDLGPGRRNAPRTLVLIPESPVSAGGDSSTELRLTLKQRHGGKNSDQPQTNNMGRFRLSYAPRPVGTARPVPPDVRAILDVPFEDRTVAQLNTVFSHWRTTVDGWAAANDRIERLWEMHPGGTTQLALEERGPSGSLMAGDAAMMRTTFRLNRGDFLRPAEAVSADVPAFLNPLPEDAVDDVPDRLDLARWVTDRRAPTTARSFVNRVWQAYFGTGLVRTADDLGTQSEPPSHPDLLDWLAVEFMDSGWDVKHLHRLIAHSATYRQTSDVTPEVLEADPNNRLLARGPRFRADAEVVRDSALAAAGLLTREVGGPSVMPPSPLFLYEPPASYGPKVWDTDEGPGRYRRALYTFLYRSVPYPALEVFDAPTGAAACVRRTRSNTPLQALTTLNEPLYVEAAAALADLVVSTEPTDPARLSLAYRRVLSREPTPAERAVLLDLLADAEKKFAAGGDRPPGTRDPQTAAWAVVCRVVLNTDEAVTKE